MYLSPLLDNRGAGPAPLGLSCLHISTAPCDDAIVGHRPLAEDVRRSMSPINGWGPIEYDYGVEAPPGFARVEPGKPDHIVSIKRGLNAISVGVCPFRIPGKRGQIQRLTASSKSRMCQVLGDLVPKYPYMGTLTVGGDWDRDGRTFKRALDRYLQWKLKEMRKRSGNPSECSIFWFLEFQSRGAPHVHYFYSDRVPWELCAMRWADLIGDPGIWRTCTRFERLRTRAGAQAYARKYARKSQQKTVPDGYTCPGRFWGIRGCRIRCTCKVQMGPAEGGGELMRKVTDLCETAVAAGLLRKLRWEHGQGAIYFARSHYESLYSIPWGPAELRGSLGHQIDWTIMQALLVGG